MSKLSERIQRLGRTENTSMGFVRSATKKAAAPGLLILARTNQPDNATVAAGADGLIFSALPTRAEGLWGLHPAGASVAGADFIIVGAQANLATLAMDGVGLVIEADEAWPDATLRSLDMFQPDGIYLNLGDAPLSLPRLLSLRRVSSLAGPLVVEASAAPDANTLQLLRDAGTAAIIVPGADRAAITALRERINALPPRRRRKEERAEATLPRLSAIAAEDDE
ncbi:MAG: hypothetical protein EXR43_05240 [Dehalococcoidia bacterium]|nr:hypothetical protein [Dehalococcoidia bacterium]